MIGAKGSMIDVFLIAILLFASMIVIIVGAYVNNEIVTNPTVNSTLNANAKAHLTKSTDILKSFDGLIVFLLFGASAAAIISAFLIRSHPAFFAVAIIMQLIMVGISSVFSNVYTYFGEVPQLAAMFNQFPITAKIMGNLPIILLGISALIAVVMYGKSSGGAQYAY